MGGGTVIREAAEAVRRHAWILLAGVLVGICAWPQPDLEPFQGIDGSWQVALHMAAAGGLDYGREIVYTFGPLGFLQVPTYVDALTVRLAFAYELLLTLLLSVSLVATLRPTFRLIPAAILALVVATASSGVQVTTVGFIWITALLLVPMPPLAARTLAGGLGLLIGLELLGKLNSGIVLLGMAVVAVAAVPAERRRLVAPPLGIAALAGAAFGWLATGQSPGAIPGYLSGSWSIISGYSEIMWSDAPDLRWHLWVALVLAGLGLVAATGGSLRPDRTHLGLSAAWLILSFTAFKEGFVRHDNGHAFFFFISMLGGFTAFAMVPRPRGPALLAGTLALTCIAATTSRDPLDWLDPRDRVSAFADQASTLADGSETNEAIARGREIIAAQAPLDDETLAALEGRDVHIGPTLAATAWAYRLRWHPLPTFQTYAAYRESLDRRNAEVMADADGPERILRHFESGIDNRRLIWDDPLTQRAMLCHFRPVTTNETWQVLERTDDRCGEPRLVAEVETGYGETTRVPEAGAGEALYVEVDGVQVHGLERLRTMAYRAEERGVIVDDEDDHRLVPGTAGGGLLLRVHPAADYPAPFSMNADAHTLRFTKGRDGTGSGDLRLRFYALPVRR